MAENRGGYRQPANPAMVSGPGAMSARTDGGPSQPARYMSGGDYGDGQEMMSLQTAAPMAAAGGSQTQGQRATARPSGPLPTPLGAPTQRPDEPVTEGNPLGPGSGPEVLSGGVGSIRQSSGKDAQALKQYLPALTAYANSGAAPESFVRFVKYIRDM